MRVMSLLVASEPSANDPLFGVVSDDPHGNLQTAVGESQVILLVCGIFVAFPACVGVQFDNLVVVGKGVNPVAQGLRALVAGSLAGGMAALEGLIIGSIRQIRPIGGVASWKIVLEHQVESLRGPLACRIVNGDVVVLVRSNLNGELARRIERTGNLIDFDRGRRGASGYGDGFRQTGR